MDKGILSVTLKEQRIKLNLSIAETAIRARLDPSLISRYEGGNRIPTREHIIRLAGALSLDEETLLIEWFVERLKKLAETDDDRPVLQKALRLALDVDHSDHLLLPSGSKVTKSQEMAMRRHLAEWQQLIKQYPSRLDAYFSHNIILLCRDLGNLAGHAWRSNQITQMLGELKTFPDHDFQSHMFIYELYQSLKAYHPAELHGKQDRLHQILKELQIDSKFIQGQNEASLLWLARLWFKLEQSAISEKFLLILAILCYQGYPLFALPKTYLKVTEYQNSIELAEFFGDWLVKEMRKSLDYMQGLEIDA